MSVKKNHVKIITWGRSTKWKGTPVKIDWRIPCNGEGIENDPYIIESSKSLPNYIEMRNSNSFIIFKNCECDSLILKHCQNIVLEDCTFNYTKLLECVQITYLNSWIIKKMRLNNSKNIEIENCQIKNLKLKHSYSNNFKNCRIKKVKRSRIKTNHFDINNVITN